MRFINDLFYIYLFIRYEVTPDSPGLLGLPSLSSQVPAPSEANVVMLLLLDFGRSFSQPVLLNPWQYKSTIGAL
jgi:hypothetical protein